MIYLYATLSASVIINEFSPPKKIDTPHQDAVGQELARRKLRSVQINGGANIAYANHLTGFLRTPYGIATRISDEDYEWLKEDPSFKHFVEKGFIRVSLFQMEEDEAVKDLNPKDGSAPVTPKDCDEDTKTELKNTRLKGSNVEYSGVAIADTGHN